MQYCLADQKYQKDVAIAFGALLSTPFEERIETDMNLILDTLRHTKECSYHNREWYDTFVDFIEQRTPRSEIPEQEFALLRRNLDLLFRDYL